MALNRRMTWIALSVIALVPAAGGAVASDDAVGQIVPPVGHHVENDVSRVPLMNALRSIVQARKAVVENIANTNTIGYKRNLVRFIGHSRISVTRDMSQGELVKTDRPLDVAVAGVGYLCLSDNEGRLFYTRRGILQLDAVGRLVFSSRQVLQPAITVPPGVTSLDIALDGIVTGKRDGGSEITIGQIQLSTFLNPEGLDVDDEGIFQETVSSGTAIVSSPGSAGSGAIRGGFVESSNVNGEEETQILEGLKAFETQVQSALDIVAVSRSSGPENDSVTTSPQSPTEILSYLSVGDVVSIHASGRDQRLEILTPESVKRWRANVAHLTEDRIRLASFRKTTVIGEDETASGLELSPAPITGSEPIYEVSAIGNDFIELRPVMSVSDHENVDFLVMSRSSIHSVSRATDK